MDGDGTPFGRYRLIELLGRGGMGEVWRAHDTATNNRSVAIKLLPSHLADDETFVMRFRREADAAARLNSPHVIPIHNYGEIDGRLYVDMRLIEGRDLQAVLADGPLAPERAVRIIEQVAKALHAAHEVGLLHRDIKPSNILIDRDDFAYLIDFGIARVLDETRMTKSGFMIGTFQYIAPERLGPRADEDARADIYSLACVLYECLTGHPPFDGDTMAPLVAAHLNTPPPRPSITQPDVPPAVDEVIATGMAKDPDERYTTTMELANAARDAITTPIPRPRAVASQAAPTRVRPPVTAAAEPTGPTMPPMQPLETGQTTGRADPGQGVAAPAPPRNSTGWVIGGTAAVVILVAVVVTAIALAGSKTPASAPPPKAKPTTYQSQVVLPFFGLDHPTGVAIDTSGSVYTTNWASGDVLKKPVDAATQRLAPFTGFHVARVAVDAAGNIYATDQQDDQVLKLAPGASTPSAMPFTGLHEPFGVAVDAAGDVYVADSGNGRVLKLPAGAGTTQTVLSFDGLGSSHPNPQGGESVAEEDVAVDAHGNVYVTDKSHQRVLKMPAGASIQSELPFTGLSTPSGLAVDTAGNVYVADEYNNPRVIKMPANTTTPTVLPFTGLKQPQGVAVDTAGNVYCADWGNERVLKLPVG